MKNKEKIFLIALSLFLVSLSSMALVATAQSALPAGPYAYVANSDDNTVSVIDTATNTVTATVPVGSGPFAVAVNPQGTKAYVVNFFSNNVSVIDTATNTVTATVPVGSYPGGVAVIPDGKKVYVANRKRNNVSVIKTDSNTVTSKLKK